MHSKPKVFPNSALISAPRRLCVKIAPSSSNPTPANGKLFSTGDRLWNPVRTGNPPAPHVGLMQQHSVNSGLPAPQGLYDPRFEHDACGIGFVANIKGNKSHEIIVKGIQVLMNLTHRGPAPRFRNRRCPWRPHPNSARPTLRANAPNLASPSCRRRIRRRHDVSARRAARPASAAKGSSKELPR